MYVIDLECMLRAAVGALVLCLVVKRATYASRDVARALRVAVGVSAGVSVGFGGGHPRRRGSRSVSCRRRGLGRRPQFRKLFFRKPRDQLSCRHVWMFMRKSTFELRDHLQRFVWKLKCELRLARCCRARALGPRQRRRSSGDLAFDLALSFVFDAVHERDFFITSRLGVTKELIGLGDVGDGEPSIADCGSDLGKILEKSHGFNTSLRLVFGVAQFFDGVIEERSAFVVRVEFSALDFFEVSENVCEEAALFAD